MTIVPNFLVVAVGISFPFFPIEWLLCQLPSFETWSQAEEREKWREAHNEHEEGATHKKRCRPPLQ